RPWANKPDHCGYNLTKSGINAAVNRHFQQLFSGLAVIVPATASMSRLIHGISPTPHFSFINHLLYERSPTRLSSNVAQNLSDLLTPAVTGETP
ncbi:hypothetical protein, partial [Litoreibacter halocynthiae]|uniref:hypothetical protein n=1 Tax=Litoreibacter halocynthiae TaxID=1242689 RepID=UPI00249275EA